MNELLQLASSLFVTIVAIVKKKPMCLCLCPTCSRPCNINGSDSHPTHRCSRGHDWLVPPVTVTGNGVTWPLTNNNNVYAYPGNMNVYTVQTAYAATAVSWSPSYSPSYIEPNDSKYQELLKENEKRQAEIEAKKLQESKEEKEKRKENLFLADGMSKRGIDLDEDLSTG